MRPTTNQKHTTTPALLLAAVTILAACASPDAAGSDADPDADTEVVDNNHDHDGDEANGGSESGGTDTVAAPEAPAAAEPITQRAKFTDDVGIEIRSDIEGRDEEIVDLVADASTFVVAEFVLEPGQKFPWHTHPGPVLINIAEADDDAFVFTFGEDCRERSYSAGEALIDPGGQDVATDSSNVHTARNDGDSDIRVVAVILGADAEEPLTIPVEPDEAAELDEVCDIVTPGHGDGH